jgi:hypothetical protein
MLIKREFKCCSGCCWCTGSQCCSQEITAESPPGTLIGTVSQQYVYLYKTNEIDYINYFNLEEVVVDPILQLRMRMTIMFLV